ncbi:hypothetical protein BDY17DRAFT_305955 [Neohortaea acidophila]|uniref:Enoyl reductase (ER) domain-containing protein n=1 Tax=Neohortaea acidophila TaxID=245834 RepID=A0A6A6PGW6_9PEZI|nr:uncharacterized protein BDY17DRAFT_305955 [Neohortaea acidophila]KAF2478863.1 hypothetical protein BDY17DRAFT_305955 [Neohortaea acidophila]
MYQAQVDEWGQAPVYTKVDELPPPSADEIQVKVLACGLHRVVRSRAAGKHYSSGTLPHVPGIDGVGVSAEGKRYYFFSFAIGAMADIVNAPKRTCLPLPEGVDPIQAAGVMNPAMSSWMALQNRVCNLPKDFTILILGATSASGRVAIHFARVFGAKKVIGAARNRSALETLGLDESIVIADEASETDFGSLADVDVVLDYVYGPLTEHLLKTVKPAKRLQYVHIGAISSPDITLPGSVLRSKNLTITGSGAGAWSHAEMGDAIPSLLDALRTLPEQPVRVAKLADVETEWASEGSERLVFVP